MGDNRKHWRFRGWALAVIAGLAMSCGPQAWAGNGTPLAERVLVVYNANNADSVSVANYYIAQRGIPSSNLCPIVVSSTTTISADDFLVNVKYPVQNCVATVGIRQILYIVFSYQTPYALLSGGRTYALDSYVADLWDESGAGDAYPPTATHAYFAESQSQGNVYAHFVSLADFRADAATPDLYSVWRLDGPTAVLAQGLVDKAIAAEGGSGPSGQGCFDRGLGNISAVMDVPGQSGAPDWDIHQGAVVAATAGFSVLEDQISTEFGTSPSPYCYNALLYVGGFGYGKYPVGLTWNSGAIGFHLDSASGLSPRSGGNFVTNAVRNGITVTSGVVSEPFKLGLLRADGFFRNLFEGANVGDALLRNTPWVRWVSINVGDPLYTPFPQGKAPYDNPSYAEDSFAVSTQMVVGGNPVTGTITLASPAGSGGAIVTLASSSSATVQVPPSVLIPEGANSASFTMTTSLVTSNRAVKISTSGAATLANTLWVQPLLLGVSASKSLIGGYPANGRVYLNGPAPTGGVTVALASTNPALTVPPTVAVPEGQLFAGFVMTTTEVSSNAVGNLSASLNGTTSSLAVTVTPAIQSLTLTPNTLAGGKTATLKVTLGAPAPQGGLTVNLASDSGAAILSSSSVAIPAGGTSTTIVVTTTPVATDTTATLTATAGSQSVSAPLTIQAPRVSSVSLSATTVGGGRSVTGTVYLTGAANAGGAAVDMQSSNAAASVASPLVVPAGATSAPFTVTTTTVQVNTPVTITATLNGSSQGKSITVTAAGLSSLALATTVAGGKTLTGTVSLSAAAPPGGTTVALQSNNVSVATVPSSVTVPAGLSSTTFVLTSYVVSSNTVVTITATLGSTQKTANVTVTAPVLSSVSLPTSSAGGKTLTGTVNLTGPAYSGGIVVQLTSSNPSVAAVPSSVTVLAGQTKVTFSVVAAVVSGDTTVTITATQGAVTKTANLKLTAPTLSSVALGSPKVGGKSFTGTVNLTGAAYSGGIAVSLSSNNPAVLAVPASVAVAEGNTSATFGFTTSVVTADTVVTVTGTQGSVTKTTVVTVQPPALNYIAVPTTNVGGKPGTVRVYLTGPAYDGITVALTSSNPAVVAVPSALVFNAGESSKAITITPVPVAVTTPVVLTAGLNGKSSSGTVSVIPPVVSGLSGSSSLRVGRTGTGTVTLTGPAPVGGVIVTLSSTDSSIASVPASLAVAEGASSASFTISAGPSTGTATLSASLGGATKTMNVTVSP